MKVRVNPDRCVGNGICEAVAPELFIVEDDGQARLLVDDIPPAQHELATEAVQSCPAQALDILDTERRP